MMNDEHGRQIGAGSYVRTRSRLLLRQQKRVREWQLAHSKTIRKRNIGPQVESAFDMNPKPTLGVRWSRGEQILRDPSQNKDIAFTQAERRQLGVGSARVPRAADGVSPLASFSHCSFTVWWFSQVGESLRRDAANHTPEACAPHFQLNGYGLAERPPGSQPATSVGACENVWPVRINE